MPVCIAVCAFVVVFVIPLVSLAFSESKDDAPRQCCTTVGAGD